METDSETTATTQSTDPVILAISAGGVALVSTFWFNQGQKGVLPHWASVAPVLLAALCFSWVYIVSAVVPEPYLDEVFHIPQAQKYCEGRFREWDDKITTPPGLYLFSILIPGVVKYKDSLGDYACSAQSLRATNAIGLLILAYLALCCRREIEARLFEAHTSTRLKSTSQYALHTAFNTALFPLLFFFSGLYYTDVVSTVAVLGAYLNHSRRVSRDLPSVFSDLLVIVLGILTLFMRQTNVFWVVVYMGGLEAVHAVKTLRPERMDQPDISTVSEQLKFYAWRYSVGDIHDPPLDDLWPDDMIFCPLSLGIAALCNPLRVLRQTWPYITVLVSFGSFVVWNGGVVLGDKSNHVATIHLPQLLYIWPFFAFFSFPLLLPYVIPVCKMGCRLCSPVIQPSRPTSIPSTKDATPATAPTSHSHVELGSSRKGGPEDKTEHGTSSDSQIMPSPSQGPKNLASLYNARVLIWLIYLLATIVLSLVIVRYNTIIHPFTLADNRHYMFYIFRYTIRRSTWIRYSLVLPYTICRWMTWGTMAGCSEGFHIAHTPLCSAYYRRRDHPAPFLSHPFWVKHVVPRQTTAEFPKPISASLPKTEAAQPRELRGTLESDPLSASIEPAASSTGLVFLLATTLSLVTAPLVEPRYFIIPWVIWRLQVPAWRFHDHEHWYGLLGINQTNRVAKMLKIFERYDVRLFVETLWFLGINVATGYIFLMKPYQWRAEDGSLLDEGRLQRFMW